METAYEHKAVEERWYSFWENSGFFKPTTSGEPLSMVIPPPNVTGALHMGHALNNTLQDVVARYYRLRGRSVLWIPGTDHAGIATQNVVEKQLRSEGLSREILGRDKFVERVWLWKKQYGDTITRQLRKLGTSLDWSRERFTMDEGCSLAVRENFVKLYQDGLIYRGEYIINWCPRCQTALSDIEVEHSDAAGHLWHIRYPISGGKSEAYIIVATTRPETLFGDMAVAVNPRDKRYKKYLGKKVQLPFCNREIPVISDEHVDAKFGTGAVKVTPAHDPNDYQIAVRHDLPFLKVMTLNAMMNDQVPESYRGLDRYDCREKLVSDLGAAGFLEETVDHAHSVGHCYRCHTVTEPSLSKQWFVAMDKLAQRSIDVVQSDEISFIPDRWKNVYFEWMRTIRPWCISRQIWWGHRIPVWYCETCAQEIVSKVDVKQCPHCTSTQIHQDEDVLDTWFSSALWPFSTLGWPNVTDDLKTYYPTTVLITGYDIITFWVSRMITMGLYAMKRIPFSDVFVHGLVRDAQGRKMSKSLGNVVDPLVLIEEKGADVLRFTLSALVTSGGQDIRLTDDKLVSSRNFVNKLWNVA
ncbi:MAG: valine--tRNA ligase, partial [Candidatus Margulisiibacteriota bacterium]